MDEKTVPLSKEEFEIVSADLQEVLTKHNVEMGITSTINLMKRVPVENKPTEDEAK